MTTSGARYQVIAGQFQGNGASPCLALRDLWRRIEATIMEGRPAPYFALSERRKIALYRRAKAAAAASNGEEG